jgi:hypothetical protein
VVEDARLELSRRRHRRRSPDATADRRGPR